MCLFFYEIKKSRYTFYYVSAYIKNLAMTYSSGTLRCKYHWPIRA